MWKEGPGDEANICQLEPDEGPTTLRISKWFSDFCHMHDNRQLTTLALLELRVAICKQLNETPYLGGMHNISLGHYYEKRPCQPYAALVNRNFTCALVSLPDHWPWSLVWERDYMCACVQHLKMTSYATDSSQAVLWTAYRPGWIWSYEDAEWSYSSVLW